MPKDVMTHRIVANQIELKRDQWKENAAYISNKPGLLEEVQKYTWTLSASTHKYLVNKVTGKSLHYFVLEHLVGEEKLSLLLGKDNIIEHLDNNGLNCTYENLHILSSDLNKAKAFSIDKMSDEKLKESIFSPFVLDVYYKYEENLFQLQVFMNNDIYYQDENLAPIEMFICQYQNFEELYLDWFYLLSCINEGVFDIGKFHSDKIYYKARPKISLFDNEKEAIIIRRGDDYYLNLNPAGDKKMTAVNKTAMIDI